MPIIFLYEIILFITYHLKSCKKKKKKKNCEIICVCSIIGTFNMYDMRDNLRKPKNW